MSGVQTLSAATESTNSTPPSAQAQLVLSFLEAGNSLDDQRILSFLSNDHFTHRFLPQKSFESMGRETALGKDQLRQALKGISSVLKTPGTTVQEIIETESKIVVHAKGNGQSVNNTPYTMEYMFIFTLENDSNGELKIVEIKEFLDSLYFKTFYESAF